MTQTQSHGLIPTQRRLVIIVVNVINIFIIILIDFPTHLCALSFIFIYVWTWSSQLKNYSLLYFLHFSIRVSMMIINMNTTVHKIKFYINWEKIDHICHCHIRKFCSVKKCNWKTNFLYQLVQRIQCKGFKLLSGINVWANRWICFKHVWLKYLGHTNPNK